MKTFSLILNSRSRPYLLERLLYSLVLTTKDISQLEILIRLDDDDPSLASSVAAIEKYSFATYFIDSRITNVHTSLNELARKSTGDYIWVMNDDCEIVTKHWDYHVLELLSLWHEVNGTICYLHTTDNSCDKGGHKKYSSFPMLTRATFEKLGYFMHEQFVGLGGDVHLYRIFDKLDCILYTNISVDHVLHRTVEQVCSPDATALAMRQNTYAHKIDCWTCDITEDVERVKC